MKIPDIELANISRFRGALMGVAMLIIILFHLFTDHTYIQLPYLWKSLFLSSICLLQFFVAMVLDKKYDPKLLRHSIVAI